MYEVTMPKLSDSMKTGQIVEWKVKAGDTVSEGDVLAEIESDKATLDLECFTNGVVAKLLRGNGEEVACGEVIATIAAEDEAPALPPAPKASAPTAAPPALDTRHAARGTQPVSPQAPNAPPGRIAISPYARMLAHEKGIDYTKLKGTGPGGRIVVADVEAAVAGGPPVAEAPTPEKTPIPPSPDEELPPIVLAPGEADVEDAPFRLKTQARFVTASKHAIPHFYMTRGADVTRLLAKKDELKEQFGGATVTHFLMLACLRAIAAHPEVNRSYDRGKIIKWKGVNLGIAVDTDQGLTVAVVRGAQGLSLAELVERTKPLVERARTGKLTADERNRPTFTITNLGMFDVEHFEPIINPPSSITLGVASALPAPVVRGDAIFVARVMRLTLSCDHRIIEGATAARFLGALKTLLEDPAALLQ